LSFPLFSFSLSCFLYISCSFIYVFSHFRLPVLPACFVISLPVLINLSSFLPSLLAYLIFGCLIEAG
jgi:hypothetical protein